MRRLAVVLAAGFLTLCACERHESKAPVSENGTPAVRVFDHRLSGDISGEYRPAPGAQGEAASLFIGQEAAFDNWEGGERSAPPLVLTLGGTQGEAEVTLETYVVTDDTVQMMGATPDGEVVQLQVRLDQGALATARRNLGDLTPVMTGTITVDGRRSALSLTRWGGD